MNHKPGQIPDPRQAGRFIFEKVAYDPETSSAHLAYRFDNGPELVEILHFPQAPWPLDEARQAAFGKALELLHLIAGVSYYKAGLSPSIRVKSSSVSAETGSFLEQLYVRGLAEFAFRNGLDISQRIRFRQTHSSRSQPPGIDLPDRALVAMGGGKDSLVGLALMQQAAIECTPVCVGDSGLIHSSVEPTGLPLLRIRRRLAPQLAAMNRAGAWNGHVPVTAINSAILLCAAILYGYRYVVFSNERSADEATRVTAAGLAVNHQYSKSSIFETDFRCLIASTVGSGIEYFSVLRPYSELDIVRKFSRMTKFHEVYSSCNRNFHLEGSRVSGRWCLDCPKCRFAALCLAVFLPPADVRRIMGGDLLDDPGQEEGFRALCQLGQEKPFECVGETGECRAALSAVSRNESWSHHAVVQALRADLDNVDVPSLACLLTPAGQHNIPHHLHGRISIDGTFNQPG